MLMINVFVHHQINHHYCERMMHQYHQYLHLLLYGLPALFLLLCLFSDYAFAVGSFKSLRWTSILYLVTMPLLLAVEVPLLIAL